MSLHDDLLEQADSLANAETGRGRPRQASLRRAVSAAYYAVFHLLVDNASRELVSGDQAEELRVQVTRAFDHREMRDVCRGIAAGNPGRPLRALMREEPGDSIVRLASAFMDLQQARHEADYDLSRHFRRTEVLDLIDRARDAFRALDNLDRKDHQRRVFLTALAMGKRWYRQ